jgi:hypothetical protein
MILTWPVKSVEALVTQEATILRSKRMWTTLTIIATIALNRIKDGISNKGLITQVTTQVTTKVII